MKFPASQLRALHRDEEGAILVYVTLIILALVALLSIAIDGARILYLNSNLQEIADAAALAGAKELDGRADALERVLGAIAACPAMGDDHRRHGGARGSSVGGNDSVG